MSYQSELSAKINGLDAQAPASDLYLAAKSLIEIGVQDIPRTFTENVYARLLQADTSDPYEIGFLNKILAMLDAWAVTTGAFGFNGQVVPIKNGALITPPLDTSYVTFPTRQWVFETPGTLDFLAVHGHELPGWIKERTLLRVRVWGAGGNGSKGGGSSTNGYYSGNGGGGGAYAESLVSFAQLSASPTLVVGSAPSGSSAFVGVSAEGGGTATANGPGLGGTVMSGMLTAPGGDGAGTTGTSTSMGRRTSGYGGGGSGGPWGPGSSVSTNTANGGGTTGVLDSPAAATYLPDWWSAYLQSLAGPDPTPGLFGAGGAQFQAGGAFGGGGRAANAGVAAGGGGCSYTGETPGLGGHGLVIVESFL